MTDTLTEHILWLLAFCLILDRGLGIGLHFLTPESGLDVEVVNLEAKASSSNVPPNGVSALDIAVSGLDTVRAFGLGSGSTSCLDAQPLFGLDVHLEAINFFLAGSGGGD